MCLCCLCCSMQLMCLCCVYCCIQLMWLCCVCCSVHLMSLSCVCCCIQLMCLCCVCCSVQQASGEALTAHQQHQLLLQLQQHQLLQQLYVTPDHHLDQPAPPADPPAQADLPGEVPTWSLFFREIFLYILQMHCFDSVLVLFCAGKFSLWNLNNLQGDCSEHSPGKELLDYHVDSSNPIVLHKV